MLKKIIKIIEKIIMAFFLIYAYNVISLPLNAIIPINIFTIVLVTVLDLPAMFGLIIFNFIIF